MDFDAGLFDALIMQESSGNPSAYNPESGARGLGQITPIALKDFNQENPNTNYTMDDMYDPQKNMRVAYWTLYKRIPQFLRNKNMALTIENVLATYNYGIGNVSKTKPEDYPDETKNYIKNIKVILNAKK